MDIIFCISLTILVFLTLLKKFGIMHDVLAMFPVKDHHKRVTASQYPPLPAKTFFKAHWNVTCSLVLMSQFGEKKKNF